MNRVLLLLLISLLAAVVVYGQEDAFGFTHLKEANGLNSNIVNCIIKGRNNKMWIGTYNGFNSYDGANFYAHKLRKGDNSLPNEVVHSLCEDKNGHIWGATNNGVFSYNPGLDKYSSYELKSAGKSPNFFNILCDKNGTVWAAGSHSLFMFNSSQKQFEEKLVPADAVDTSQHYFITKNGLAEEPASSRLWIATAGGLWYYDYKNNRAGNAVTEKNNPLFTKRNIASLHRSHNGNFWVFDNDKKAVIQFNPSQKKEIQQISIGGYLPNAMGATLFEDKSNRLWLSSWTNEILVIDLADNNRVQRLYHRNDDSRTIAGNFFWTGYQDANNTIWLGTLSGISRCNPEKAFYKEYRLSGTISELKNSPIQIVEQDPADNSFWIVTKDNELLHYYPATIKSYEKFLLHDAVKNKEGQLPGTCTAIKFLGEKIILVTSNGVWQTERRSKKIIPFNGLPKGYETLAVMDIVADADSVLYFSSGKQILYWNKLLSTTQLFSFAGGATPENISGMCITPSHKLWLLTSDKQLVELSNGVLQVRNLNRDFNNEPGSFWSLVPGEAGDLWILSRGAGIYRYNTGTQKTELWNMTDGLPANRMHEVAADKTGKLWSVHYNKVAVLTPATKEIYNFSVPYSEDDLGYDNHLTRLANGNILGTIKDELVEFFPERLATKPVLEKPIIGQLKTRQREITELDESAVELNTDENTIGIKFGCLISKEIFPYEMEYKLTGGNNVWTTADGHEEIFFTNLAPGEYTFKVRAKGTNNVWQTEEAVVRFTIKTPWYKAAWFRLTLLLLIGAAAWLFYRFRLRKQKQILTLETKAQELEKEKTMVMFESLKQQLNPHFLFNSLTSLSGLIETNQPVAVDFLEQMSGIYRYILKNSENETVLLKDELVFVQLYINLQQTRFKKGLVVNSNVPEDYLHYKIAPVTLQNMIENAIKHNIIDTGSPLVIDIFTEGDYLVVKNNLQKKNVVETSNKKGLTQFVSLYKYLSPLPVIIEETEKAFMIRIPLI